MPIVEIRSLPPKDPTKIPEMLKRCAVDGARAFAIPESKVWALFEEVRPGWYVEGSAEAPHPGDSTHPPLVLVRALSGRDMHKKTSFMKAICKAIGEGLSIPPSNVWIHLIEMEKSHVWHDGAFAG